MTLLDRFRTQPRHKHPESAVRLAYVAELPLDDREAIAADGSRRRRATGPPGGSRQADGPGDAGRRSAQSDPDESVRAAGRRDAARYRRSKRSKGRARPRASPPSTCSADARRAGLRSPDRRPREAVALARAVARHRRADCSGRSPVTPSASARSGALAALHALRERDEPPKSSPSL